MPQMIQNNPKYDWETAFLYFLAGMKHEEIERVLSIPYARIVEYSRTHKWTQRRSSAQAHSEKALKADLARRIEKAKVDHQNFVLDIVEREQKILQDRTTTGEDGEKQQGERLALVDKLDTIARRTLKLDDDKTQDPTTFGFGVLVALATHTLPGQSEANTGILRPLNGHSNGMGQLANTGQDTINAESEVITGPADPEPELRVIDGEALLPTPKTINFTPQKPLVNENPDELV